MKPELDFHGTFTALITPMTPSGVDWQQLTDLVERQIEGGVQGLVPVGTTGESPTLNPDEHLAVIEAVVRTAKGRVSVIAGTGANATAEALHLTREADKLGADAFLQVAPYYNKPSQEGVFAHFSLIAEVTSKPILLYSIPGRCGIEIAIDTVAKLANACPNIRAIKEASGSVARVYALRQAAPSVTVLAGDDGVTAPFIAAGAKGVVSVASNLAPRIIADFTNACLRGDFQQADALYAQYAALFTDLVFMDGNPVTIKEALFQAGLLPDPFLRLPLVRTSAANQAAIRRCVDRLGLSRRLSA